MIRTSVDEPSMSTQDWRAASPPVGTGTYVVREGECLSTIAESSGHFWQTLWEDPANAAVKEARHSPGMPLPGDRLSVPPLRQKSVACQTGRVHQFRRRGVPAFLHLRLFWSGEPRAHESYTIVANGRQFTGTTDAEGKLTIALPRDTFDATLVVGEDERREEIVVRLGTLPPVDVLDGVVRRLANLGFDGGPADDADARLRFALERFQASAGVTVDGELTDEVRAKLVERHGC
jgi:N-acetylmuramoyl-L-alanine amidase